MRGTPWCRIALGLVSLGVAAGCRSLPSPPSLLDGGLVSSSSLSPEAESAARAHAWFAIGVHHEMRDEYPLAYEAYRRALDADPGNERLALRMATALLLQRKTEEALLGVEEFLAVHPDSQDALIWLATFYGTTGDRERSRQLFEQVTRKFPANPVGWLQLAAIASEEGDTQAVVDLLEAGVDQAKPPTSLRRELVRINLALMRDETDPDAGRDYLRRAIDGLRAIADEQPSDVDAWLPLGELLAQDQRYSEALEAFAAARQLDPDDERIPAHMAHIHLAMDDMPGAIAILEEMAQAPDSPAQIHLHLGDLHLRADDEQKAKEHFRKAAAAGDGTPLPWMRLAAIEADDDEAAAIAILEEGLAAIPDDPKLLEVLAFIRLGQNEYAQADRLMARIWERVSAEDSEAAPSTLFLYNYSLVASHLRRTAEAAEWLRLALEHNPGVLDLYVQRTLTGSPSFRRSGIRVLRALAKLQTPDQTAIHAALASIYLSLDRTDDSLRQFDAALDAAAANPLQAEALTPRFHFWHGVALDQDGQTDRAIEAFQSCIQLDPAYADALNYLAYTWAVRGERLDEALRHVQAALAVDPENAAYLDTLGWVCHRMGRYEEALRHLREADRLRPNDPEILDHIEQTLRELERLGLTVP
jgi:tetratricopeptide (TPR) repeat protein